MRKRVYAVIEPSENGEKCSSIYNIYMMLAIIISIIPLCTKSEALWTVIIDIIMPNLNYGLQSTGVQLFDDC